MIFLELFWTFLKIGAFTFGGGYAMLPLIQSEVLSHEWISADAFVDFIAVSESTPGPFAVNIATYIGSTVGTESAGGSVPAGIFGAFCATLGVILPAFLVMLILVRCYQKYQHSLVVNGMMSGMKPAVVGLIAAAFLRMAFTVFLPNGFVSSAVAEPAFWISLGILAVMTFAAFKKVHPVLIIAASAVLGIGFGYIFQLNV